MHTNFYNALTISNLYVHIAAFMRLYTNIMFQYLNEHLLISQFIIAGILLSIHTFMFEFANCVAKNNRCIKYQIYFKKMESLFEYYEAIIFVRHGQIQYSPTGFIKYLIPPRPKSSPYNIWRMIFLLNIHINFLAILQLKIKIFTFLCNFYFF